MTTLPAHPPLSYGISLTRKRRQKRLKFHEHYTASFTLGINGSQQIWRLIWKDLNDDDVAIIDDFFEDLAEGLLQWTPPGQEAELNFTCGDSDSSYDGFNKWNFSIEIEQDFTPT